MPGRRAFLQRILGGGGVLLGHGFVATTRPARAAQQKSPPQCPRCMSVFGLCVGTPHEDLQYLYPSARVVDGAVVTNHCVTYVPVDVIATPGKAWPVQCNCGWSGTAVFYEAQET